MKLLIALAAATALIASLAGCGSTAGGTGSAGQNPASTARVWDADSLVAVLKEAEHTVGAGTITDNAALREKAKAAADTGVLDSLTSSGAVIAPAACAQALSDAGERIDNSVKTKNGHIGAALAYQGGVVGIAAIDGKPLPASIEATQKANTSKLIAVCTSMTITIASTTIPMTITEVEVKTDADEATGYSEKFTIAGTKFSAVAVTAVFGNLLITDERIGTTEQAVTAINGVVAAAKADSN